MDEPQSDILRDFPYPIAYPYAAVFDTTEPAVNRRWALCYTQYQLARFVGLTLVSHYLNLPVVKGDTKSQNTLNKNIADLSHPFFTTWIDLLHVFRKHSAHAGLDPLFPELAAALQALNAEHSHPVGRPGSKDGPLGAIVTLRNETAHGSLAEEIEAERHLEHYVPLLHHVLAAFAFVAATRLSCARTRRVPLLRP